MSALLADNISVRFGGVEALHQVTVTCDTGRITGLIGPNGAGKTTLFNVISGALRPLHGRVLIDGHDVTRYPMHRRATLGVGRTFQRPEIFSSMTVRDNLLIAAETSRGHGRPNPASVVGETLNLLDLEWAADQPAGTLSFGTARLVELGRALCTDPRILLLDEPSSGLDTHESEALGIVLHDVCTQRQVAMLLVEHAVDLVMRICDEIVVLDLGCVIARGAPETVADDVAVRRAYLGGTQDVAAPRG